MSNPSTNSTSNRGNEWWESFFTGLWLKVQRDVKNPEQSREEAGYVEQALALEPGSKVLDVPCGVGRLSLELADRGHQVTGIDITGPFVDDARHEAERRGLSVGWYERDMRDISWTEEFDAVACFWGSFGYFDEEGNREFLKNVANCLKSGGRFLVDTHVTETLLPRLSQMRSWKRVSETIVLEDHDYDHVTSRTETKWTLIGDGEIFEESTSIRLYSYRELCSMLADVGLSAPEASGRLCQRPFGLESSRLWLVTTKK